MFVCVRVLFLRGLLVMGLIVATSLSAVSATSGFTSFDISGAGSKIGQGTYTVGIDAAGNVLGIYTDVNYTAHGYLRAANGTITVLDVPGAGTGKYKGTTPVGIDAAGDITGLWVDANNVSHGFVRAGTNGTIISFDVHGVGTLSGQGTFPIGIDTAGDIAGIYKDTNNVDHGFVRTADGTITAFDVTGAVYGTAATSINTAGLITGAYRDTNGAMHGFVRSTNSQIVNFDAPNAGSSRNQGTLPSIIDASGNIAGVYSDANDVKHAFLRNASGTIISFDASGAGSGQGQGTFPIGIDTSGDVAGVYVDANKVQHGFVRAASGTIATFDAPGASTVANAPIHSSSRLARLFRNASGTDALSISGAGIVAGTFFDTGIVAHGFLRSTDGSITVFDEPNAGTSTYQGTVGFAINASGTIAGTYADTNSLLHGFVYTAPSNTTTTTLTSTPSSSLYGEPVTLDAKVIAPATAIAPPDGETVWFMDDTTSLGSKTLSSGAASLTITTIPSGTNSITAVYGGDTNFAGSTSAAISQTVSRASSTTTLKSSLNPSTSGQAVALTATVYAQLGGLPTGQVIFENGGTPIAVVPLSGGVASVVITLLPVGANAITAVYSGDTNFSGSTSNSVSQVITSPSTGTTGLVATGFSQIRGLATDANGSVYVADAGGGNGGSVGVYEETLANSVQVQTNLSTTQAYGVAVDGARNVYYAGSNGTAVYKLTLTNGNYVQSTVATGFSEIRGVAADTSGNVYVADAAISGGGVYEIYSNSNGQRNQIAAVQAYGVAVDGSGNVYYAGNSGTSVYKLTSGNYAQSTIGTGFSEIRGLASDAGGNIYVADAGGSQGAPVGLYQVITSSGTYSKTNLSTMPSYGVAVDGSGNVYYAGDHGVSVYTLKVAVAAIPTFSVPSGGYSSSRTVTISDATSGATIYYTTDGTTPTTSSTVYSAPITVSSTMTINAIAGGSGLATSGVATASYVMNMAQEASFSRFSASNTAPASGENVTITANVQITLPTSRQSPSGNTGRFWIYDGSAVLVAGAMPNVAISDTVIGFAYVTSELSVGTHVLSAKYVGTYNGVTAGSGQIYVKVAQSAAATPTFSVTPGTYTTAQTVGISDATSGAVIYYTTDGTTPTTNSAVYSAPITVSTTETLEAIATATGYSTSAVATAPYTITPVTATPTFSVAPGTYTTAQTVGISDATSGAVIYYTTNGTTPTTSSAVYSAPITVSTTETLEAIATATGHSTSAVATAPYTITPVTATPTFSVTPGTYTTAQTVGISDATSGAVIYYTTDGTTPTTSSTVYSAPITVSTTETLEAIATATGHSTSAVATAPYTITPVTATPTFSVTPGTYTTAQTVGISDATSGAVIYYTTNGTTPTTSSAVYSAPITVSTTETLEAIATATGHSTSAVATAPYTITPVTATPTFSVTPGTYTTAQTVGISDATSGAVIYYTTDGTTPTTSSTVYSAPITVSTTETLEAIATATGYSPSAVATAPYTISIASNPVPVLTSMSPAFTTAGSAAFSLVVTGSGFSANSTVYWGSTALTTQFGSATQLTAHVPAANIANARTNAITVQTPAPGGGSSNALQFEVDSATTGTTTAPTITTPTASVVAGSPANYPVTVPSTVTSIAVSCLNLPAGATCSYSSTTNAVTIATSATTPKGTYQVTVVFTETVAGATTAGILLPILLLPLVFLRRRMSGRGYLIATCFAIALMATTVLSSVGCGSGSTSSATAPATHQVTSSGAVSLTIQ